MWWWFDITSLDIQTRINLIFRKTVSKQVPQLHQTPVWDNTHLDGLVVSIPADLDSHDNIPELLLRRQDHFVLSVFLLTVNSNVSSIFKPYFILQSLILKSNKCDIFFSVTVYNIKTQVNHFMVRQDHLIFECDESNLDVLEKGLQIFGAWRRHIDVPVAVAQRTNSLT